MRKRISPRHKVAVMCLLRQAQRQTVVAATGPLGGRIAAAKPFTR
jgi:hypothetical protein